MVSQKTILAGSRWSPFVWLRVLYDWVTTLAQSPHGSWALFLVAVAESSVFPIPPDVLLIALAVATPSRSLFFALICTLGSVVGAAIGYLLGFQFYQLVGGPIIEFYGAAETYHRVQELYREWNALAVGIAGFSQIPFKLFTIAAGAFHVNFPVFLLASAVSRSARFFLVGALILRFGPRIRRLIDRYFNWLAVIFSVLVVGGFLLLKYVI